MARFLKSRKDALGKVPGELIHIGSRKMEVSEMQLVIFAKDKISEIQLESVTQIPVSIPEDSVMWLNIIGLHDVELISSIGERFSIPSLELEDILNTDQRPKITEDKNNINIFLQVMEFRSKTQKVHGDQISLVLGKNYPLTFQENKNNVFNSVSDRLRNNKGNIRGNGPDYLTFALIDTLIDFYLHTIELLGETTESFEYEVFHQTKKETIESIYNLKTNISFVRKNIWPLKEIIIYLNRADSGIIHKNTLAYFRDLQDLTIHALEAVDIYHTLTNDFLTIYNTYTNNRANEIMKVLTIFLSVFTPLSLITGVYGTNFVPLPGSKIAYGFYLMLCSMGIIVFGMFYYFRKKKWW